LLAQSGQDEAPLARRVTKLIALQSRTSNREEKNGFAQGERTCGFIIFLFAIFIPTVNRSLNL
jgi:hypothetical protein